MKKIRKWYRKRKIANCVECKKEMLKKDMRKVYGAAAIGRYFFGYACPRCYAIHDHLNLY